MSSRVLFTALPILKQNSDKQPCSCFGGESLKGQRWGEGCCWALWLFLCKQQHKPYIPPSRPQCKVPGKASNSGLRVEGAQGTKAACLLQAKEGEGERAPFQPQIMQLQNLAEADRHQAPNDEGVPSPTESSAMLIRTSWKAQCRSNVGHTYAGADASF